MGLLSEGWVCPKCGAVMSPYTSVCVNCTGQYSIEVSTNSSSDFSGAGKVLDLQKLIDQQVDDFVKCNLMDGKGEGE